MGLRNPWALGVGSAVAILTQPIEGVLKSGLGSTVICLIDTPSAAVYHMKFKAGMQEACQQKSPGGWVQFLQCHSSVPECFLICLFIHSASIH